jgi:LmbE family N-acetylglucosaminyl deacetylase
MKKTKNSRRNFVKNAAAGLGILPLSALVNPQHAEQVPKKKIVCVGGHPDDPETGCGGTLAKLATAGHDVTVIYLTTGEAGIPGRSHDEAARIRKEEGLKACKVLKAKPIFAGQIDGDTLVNSSWIKKMHQLIIDEKPDIAFTHWPVDYHPDHQAASLLTIQAWMKRDRDFWLYFYEVQSGLQTSIFHPTDYVDISDTQEQKWKAIDCHVSQDPKAILESGHRTMEMYRGLELGVKAGEAFVRMTGRLQGGMIV